MSEFIDDLKERFVDEHLNPEQRKLSREEIAYRFACYICGHDVDSIQGIDADA